MCSNLQKLEAQNWAMAQFQVHSAFQSYKLKCDENTKKSLTKFTEGRDIEIQHFIPSKHHFLLHLIISLASKTKFTLTYRINVEVSSCLPMHTINMFISINFLRVMLTDQ